MLNVREAHLIILTFSRFRLLRYSATHFGGIYKTKNYLNLEEKQTMSKKYVYLFSEGNKDMRNLASTFTSDTVIELALSLFGRVIFTSVESL